MNETRPRKTHELKEWPEFFAHTLSGRKKFQLRKNDRDFRVGDELLIKEYDPKAEYGSPADNTAPVGHTGRATLLRVDYIMDAVQVDGFIGMNDNFIIMSTSLLP